MDTTDFDRQNMQGLFLRGFQPHITLIASFLIATLLFIGSLFWILGSKPLSAFLYNTSFFGSSNSAIAEFTKAVQLEPNNEQAYLLLASAYQLTGDLDAVQQVWEEARRKNKDVTWAYKHQAQFHQSFRQTDDIIYIWQQAVAENLHTSWGYIELAKAHQQARNWPAVEATWQSAIDANQSEIWPYQRLANYYKSRKKWTLVEQTYRRAIQQIPNEPTLYQLLGNHLFSHKDWQGAIDIYQTSLTLSPNLASSHLNLGRSLLRTNQKAAGIESLEQAILLEPTAANYKILRQSLGYFPIEEQIASYQRILVSAPDNVTARYRVAKLYQLPEQCEAAIETAQTGVEIHETEFFYRTLATFLQKCDDLDGAMGVYSRAAAQFPYSPNLSFILGRLQLGQGDVRNAISSFAAGLRLQETPKNYRNVNKWFADSLPIEQVVVAMHATVTSAEPTIAQPYQNLIQKYRVLGQSEEALSVMTLATRANPESIWAYTELANSYIEYDRPNDALAVYDRAIALNPENMSMHYARAQFLYEQGKFADAVKSYQQADALSPQNRAIHTRMGRALIATGQVEHGVRKMELGYQIKPDNNTYRFMRVTYEDFIEWPLVHSYQERAALLRWAGNPAVAYRNLANMYVAADRPEVATYTYKQALRAEPENIDTLTQLTNFSLAQSDCKSANKYGLQIIRIKPNSTTYRKLANIYAICGPSEAVQIALQRSVESYLIEQIPQSHKKNIINSAIRHYRNVLEEEQVIAYLTNAIATFEFDHIHPHMQLAWYYEAKVDPPNPQEALVHYQQAITKRPNYFKAVATVGRLLHDSGEPEEAIPHYRKAILLRQNDQSVRARYGRALVETGEVEQGQTVLALALKLKPNDWYTNYAIEGYLTSMPPMQALGYVTKTLTLVRPKSEEIYMSPVRYYLGLGNSDAAIAILQLASENNPKLDWPNVKLSYIYRELQEYDLAIDEMLTAIERRPQAAWNYGDLGALYRDLGNLDAALPNLSKAAELRPRNAWNHIYYGRALLESGQTEAGSDALYLALERRPDEDVYDFASALFKQYLTADDARNTYVLLLENNPKNAMAQRYLGLLYRELGDLDAALLNLAQAVALKPKMAWNHIYYSQALLESGQAEAGHDELYLALQVDRTNEAYRFADDLFKEHLTADDARNTYALLLETDPNNELARRYLDRWSLGLDPWSQE